MSLVRLCTRSMWAVLAVAALFWRTPLPEITTGDVNTTEDSYGDLFSHGLFVFAVAALHAPRSESARIYAGLGVLAALVGSTLSVAGASYQGVFRNPLVDPYLLGVAAGAGLGATVVFTVNRSGSLSWPVDPLPLAAFAGALVAVLVTYAIGASFGGTGLTLVLAGVAVASLGSAVQQFLLLRNSDVIKEVYGWISGRVSSATWDDIRLVTPYVVVSCAVLLAHRRHLDVLRVGDDEASTLGAEVRRIRLIVVIAASLGTAAVVSVSGLIGFVGIMVPHLVRLVAGSSYRLVLPLSILVGAAFLILADIPGRMIEHGGETPIGVVTALVGAPMFIFVLRTRRSLS